MRGPREPEKPGHSTRENPTCDSGCLAVWLFRLFGLKSALASGLVRLVLAHNFFLRWKPTCKCCLAFRQLLHPSSNKAKRWCSQAAKKMVKASKLHSTPQQLLPPVTQFSTKRTKGPILLLQLSSNSSLPCLPCLPACAPACAPASSSSRFPGFFLVLRALCFVVFALPGACARIGAKAYLV